MRRLLVLASVALAGCPKVPLQPPPKVAGGPVAEMLANRAAAIRAIEADVTIRMRIPEGMDGAPGGKVRGHVVSASDPDRARLDVWTPIGTLGAILLIAEGELQVYSPLENTLMKGPLDSKDLAARSPFPIPMSAVPSLMRGAVRLVDGTAKQTDETTLEVRDGETLVQRVTIDKEGGYPVKNELPQSGLTIEYLEYGGVETPSGPLAIPQKVAASVVRPEGTVSLEVTIANPKVNPSLADDAFRLAFITPPRVEEFP